MTKSESFIVFDVRLCCSGLGGYDSVPSKRSCDRTHRQNVIYQLIGEQTTKKWEADDKREVDGRVRR